MESHTIAYISLLVAVLLAGAWFVSEKRAQARRRIQEEQRRIAEGRLQARRADLIQRFGVDLAEIILSRKIQQGMTSEHVLESWGTPADVDQKVFKTKIKETWKCGEIGKNRYLNRVFLENEIVVGWDTK